MLQILAHSNLPHQLVLVSVHTGELTDVSESELKTIGELESVDVSESILNVRVDDEFRESKDFSTQVESVSESRLLSFFRRESLDGFQVHVVIEMEVVQVLSVNEEVEHVVTLSADLKTSFDPINRSRLEELGRLDCEVEIRAMSISSRRTNGKKVRTHVDGTSTSLSEPWACGDEVD